MSGASAFIVPTQGWIYAPAVTDSVWVNGQWHRQVPDNSAAGTDGSLAAPTGVAGCNALELLSPPTLRTAYDIYAVSIAWGVILDAATITYANGTPILAEIALLIGSDVRWSSQGSGLSFGSPGIVGASGVITADLVNSLRINPRESLSLRLGIALTSDAAPTAPARIVAGVAQQPQLAGTTTWNAVQSTISYQIIDLPGNRVL